jgi:drug/metabolite transporter (DMT)-like permease
MAPGSREVVLGSDAFRAAWWTMSSCTLNAYTYEATVRYDRSAGQFISFVQVVVVALVTSPGALGDLLGRWRDRRNARFCALEHRLKLVLKLVAYFLFFYGSIYLTNVSVQLGVSIQLVHLFRAGTLVAALIFAALFERKRYATCQYLSVLAVTVGLAWATLALQVSKPMRLSIWEGARASPAQWLGVLLLVVNCFLSPAMGMLQQSLLVPASESSRDALSKTELVCIQHWVAAFLFWVPSRTPSHGYFREHARALWHAPVPLSSHRGQTSGELLIAMNAATQYLCMQSVVQMHISSRSVLYVQLVTALRKLVSVLLSAQLFGTALRSFEWASVVLVFGGTLGYVFGHGRASSFKNELAWRRKKIRLQRTPSRIESDPTLDTKRTASGT